MVSLHDVPTWMSWNQDMEAQRWFDWPTEMPPHDQHEEHSCKVIEECRADRTAGHGAPFSVRGAAGGVAVGSVDLQPKHEGEWFVSCSTQSDSDHGACPSAIGTRRPESGFTSLIEPPRTVWHPAGLDLTRQLHRIDTHPEEFRAEFVTCRDDQPAGGVSLQE